MAFRNERYKDRIKSFAASGENVHIEYKACVDKVNGSVYETMRSFFAYGKKVYCATIMMGKKLPFAS